jgi:(p)ppGpp synthase/HD superfamily hydrolase
MNGKEITDIANRWVNATDITVKERKARALAISATQETNHKYDGREYIVHLALVRDVAERYKHLIPEDKREDLFCACWCHDLIEDNRLTYNDIKAVLGETVADYVYGVTDEKGKTRADRQNDKFYAELFANIYSAILKLFDREANIEYGRYYQNDASNTKMIGGYRKSFPKMKEKYIAAGITIAEPIIRDIETLLSLN